MSVSKAGTPVLLSSHLGAEEYAIFVVVLFVFCDCRPDGRAFDVFKRVCCAGQGVWGELGVGHDQRLGLMGAVASGVLREAEAQLEEVGAGRALYK